MEFGDHRYGAGRPVLPRARVSHALLLDGRGANGVATLDGFESCRVSRRGGTTMIDILARLSIVAVVSAQAPQTVEQVRDTLKSLSDSALVERARRRPGGARGAVDRLMDAARTDDSTGLASLDAAARFARAYATAWSDSFFVRRVARYRGLSSAERTAEIAADSVLGAATGALHTSGADAAMPIFLQALRAFTALNDSVGVLVTIDNMGVAFFYLSEIDSAEAYFTRAFDLAERTGY